jgi:hypothetical protein
MTNFFEVNMKDARKQWEDDRKYWVEWQKTRIIKRCKCGKRYSYGKDEDDPKYCVECR